ncbi:MAG: hypothetical protein WBB98_04880 [Xanthobacteraceae bacterium]
MTIWPQIVYITLTCFGVGVTLARYGEAKVSRYDWTDIFATALVGTILYFGGFFAPIGFAP